MDTMEELTVMFMDTMEELTVMYLKKIEDEQWCTRRGTGLTVRSE